MWKYWDSEVAVYTVWCHLLSKRRRSSSLWLVIILLYEMREQVGSLAHVKCKSKLFFTLWVIVFCHFDNHTRKNTLQSHQTHPPSRIEAVWKASKNKTLTIDMAKSKFNLKCRYTDVATVKNHNAVRITKYWCFYLCWRAIQKYSPTNKPLRQSVTV